MSPAAQEILLSFNGPDYLSHVILGHRLKYAVLILAAWRVMPGVVEAPRAHTNRFLDCGDRSGGALLYQGRTGGELVYEHSVGMERRTVNAQQIGQPSEDKLTIGKER
jgi:hypothetical protein